MHLHKQLQEIQRLKVQSLWRQLIQQAASYLQALPELSVASSIEASVIAHLLYAQSNAYLKLDQRAQACETLKQAIPYMDKSNMNARSRLAILENLDVLLATVPQSPENRQLQENITKRLASLRPFFSHSPGF